VGRHQGAPVDTSSAVDLCDQGFPDRDLVAMVEVNEPEREQLVEIDGGDPDFDGVAVTPRNEAVRAGNVVGATITADVVELRIGASTWRVSAVESASAPQLALISTRTAIALDQAAR